MATQLDITLILTNQIKQTIKNTMNLENELLEFKNRENCICIEITRLGRVSIVYNKTEDLLEIMQDLVVAPLYMVHKTIGRCSYTTQILPNEKGTNVEEHYCIEQVIKEFFRQVDLQVELEKTLALQVELESIEV